MKVGDIQALDVTDLKPAEGFILQGDRGGDELGYSVSGAGDINGDGYDDLIAGALNGDDGMGNAGEAYVVYGKADPADEEDAGTQFGTTDEMGVMRQVLDTSTLAPAAGFIIQGDTGGDQLGISSRAPAMSMAMVWPTSSSEPIQSDDGGTSNVGEAYILYGKAGTDGTQFGTAVEVDFVTADGTTITLERQVLDTTDLAQTDGFILRGDAAVDELGISVSGAGDVNGDGYDDLIAGAPKGDDDPGNGCRRGLCRLWRHAPRRGRLARPDPRGRRGAGASRGRHRRGEKRPPRARPSSWAARATTGSRPTPTPRSSTAARATTSLTLVGRTVISAASTEARALTPSCLGMDVASRWIFTEASDRGRVRGIETLSLSDATAEVTLNLLSVYALVESRDNGGDHTSAGEAFLRLEGTFEAQRRGHWSPRLLLIDDGLVA